MLDILEGYAFGPDFYIRCQTCVPLSEMAARRRKTLPDGTKFMSEAIAERIKEIAVRMLRDADSNPALLDDISNVLGRIGDFTEAQATEIIDRLSAAGTLTAFTIVAAFCSILRSFARPFLICHDLTRRYSRIACTMSSRMANHDFGFR